MVRLMEAQSGMMVPRGAGNGELVCNGDRVPVGEDEKVPRMIMVMAAQWNT